MSLREIFRFEVRQRLRQPSTWIYLAMLVVLALLRADSTDTEVVRYHSALHATASTLMVGVLATLITAGLFVENAQRDLRWRMHPLFYSLPISRRDYLGGRFCGAFAVNALLLLAVPIGLVLGALLPSVDAATLGPLRISAYVVPYVAFLLPNVLVNAAVLFSITILTRRTLAGYLGALALIVLYMFTGLSERPDTSPVAALLDPTGAAAVMKQTAGWTRVELNTLPIRIEGLVLWNRLLWTAFAMSVIALTMRRFRFAHAPSGRDKQARDRCAQTPDTIQPLPPARQSFDEAGRLRQLLETTRFAFRQTALSVDFVLIAIGLFVLALMLVMEVPLFGGIPTWPLTHEVAETLTGIAIQLVIALLTAFYAGELLWRERDSVSEKITDSLPLPDWVPFLGKLLALSLMLTTLQAVLMAAGIIGQALQGYTRFEPLLYVQLLFGLQLPDYFLFAVLAMFVHVLVSQKYLGHLVAVLLFLAIQQAPQVGIEHNLLLYGSDPGWIHSHLNGFGRALQGFIAFKLYWTSWALLFCAAALLLWTRGAEGGLRARLRLVLQRFTRRAATGTAVAIALVMLTGGFVFYNTNVLNDYRTARATRELHAEYERRYKRFEHAPQPSLKGLTLHVEVYPERNAATVRGTYRLVNETDRAIDAIHLTSAPNDNVAIRAIAFSGGARRVTDDPAHAFRSYTLARPLQPRQTLQLQIELDVAPRGFRNRAELSSNGVIAGRFTNLPSNLLPTIGYQRDLELSNAAARREAGLPPADVRPSIDDARARRVPRIARVEFEGTIGTAANQTAIMPGMLQRTWTSGKRRYFHYRAGAPILNFFTVLSGEYAVKQAVWNGVDIRLFRHRDHTWNVDRAVRGVQIALDTYTKEFGPYPYKQVWLTEFPRYSDFGRAHGGHIVYSENNPIALARMDVRDRDTINPPVVFTAHELAHQWWGQQVMGADVQGSQVLSETLAQYSGLLVLERTDSIEPVRRFLRRMHLRYLYGRGGHGTAEVPLMLTEDHNYLHYGKGAVVMYAVRDAIGEARVNAALRNLVQKFGMQGPPYPTARDLYNELLAVAPQSTHSLLHDLIATITSWDLQTTGARAQRIGNGEHRVTVEVQAAKVRSDSAGNDTPIPMNDLVDIGIFAAPENDQRLGKPLYLAKHRIRSGQQSITIPVRGTPAHAGIDPFRKLIARHAESLEREFAVTDVKIE